MHPRTSSESCRANVSAPAAPSIAPDDTALSPAEFDGLIARACPVRAGAAFAVAVSGGGDSMALALLADAWARATGRTMRAVTVDHRLRTGSTAEADQVGAWLAARGIRHDILAWTDDKPPNGLQAAARAARYRLIGDWARRNGIAIVLLAHQLEDQAETLLMRLARGSGISGLAAMRGASTWDGLRLGRPLLSIPRARLRATLRELSQDWIEDPSNESPRFARTRFRRLVAALGARNLPARRMAELAEKFAKLDAHLQGEGRRFLGAAAEWRGAHYVTVDRVAYAALPDPLASVVLRQVLAAVSDRHLAPRSERLAHAVSRLCDGDYRTGFTLGYCRFDIRGGRIEVRPEAGRRRARGKSEVFGSFPPFSDAL